MSHPCRADQVLSSVEQDDSAGELDAGEEISGEFVVARGDGAKVLEFVEEALDEIAFAVEREVAILRGLAIGLWGITGANSRRQGNTCTTGCGVDIAVSDRSMNIGSHCPRQVNKSSLMSESSSPPSKQNCESDTDTSHPPLVTSTT